MLLGSIGSAYAADMALKAPPPVAPAWTWSGFYVGGNVGGGWGQTTGNFVTATPDFAAAIAVGQIPSSLGLQSSGVIGGGQLGYNRQSGAWLFGLEADLEGSGVRGGASLTSGIPVTINNASNTLDWFGSARARIGVVAQPNWLLYATGGVAFGQTRDSHQTVSSLAPAGGNFIGSVSQTRVGWTAGGGVEWMFARQWTAKAEYLYMDLGGSAVTSRDTTGIFPASTLTYQFAHCYNIARIGLNYHF
jgi:outer membrane immunogenic protein